MKKTFSLICTIVSAQLGMAQSLALLDHSSNVTGTIITIPIVANSINQNELKIQNLTGNNITYKVDRVFLTPPVCSNNNIYFCAAGNCYPPDSAAIIFSSGSDNIAAFQTLPSNATNFGILADYDVGPICCSEDVLYKVYDMNNTSDFAAVTLRYQCVSGISDNEKSVGSISGAFPNPSNTIVSIKYYLSENADKGKIVLYDLSGKLVKELNLQNKQGVVKIDVSDVNAGVYFYSFVVDDKTIATKKLIITSK